MLKVKFHTLATWCQEPTHWKGPWCWERLKAGGEGDEIGWDGCMASPSIDMSLSKFWEVIKDRKAWHAAVHGIAKSWTDLNKKNYVFLVAWFSNFTFYFLKYFLHVYILCMINWLLFGLSSNGDLFQCLLSDLCLWHHYWKPECLNWGIFLEKDLYCVTVDLGLLQLSFRAHNLI